MDLADDDILDAMKTIPGFIDITPNDFKEIYKLAYGLAVDRMARARLARDVMTRDVTFVTATTPLQEAAATMARRRVSGLPVVNDGQEVLGIISEKDFWSQMGGPETRSFMDVVAQCLTVEGCVAATLHSQQTRDIMTTPAVTVTAATPVSEIASIFDTRGINRVPVVDQQGRLIGIVSRADIVRTSCMV
jgi:CBS domain-containing protein